MAITGLRIYKSLLYSDYLELPLRDYSSSQLAITNITGLAPVSANVNISDYAARDGGVFNSSRIGTRNIVITMKLFNEPSMDAVRNKVYSACPVGEPIVLVVDWDDGETKAIGGYVESTEADYFGEQEGIQVSILCPDPLFYSVNLVLGEHEEQLYERVHFGKLLKFGDTYSETDFSTDLPASYQKILLMALSGTPHLNPSTWIYDEKGQEVVSSAWQFINESTSMVNQNLIYLAYASVLDLKELYMHMYFQRDIYPPIEEGVPSVVVYDKNVYTYVLVEDDASWEEETYYYYDEETSDYILIETELEFNYRTEKYTALEESTEFVPDTYYALSDFPSALDTWIPVDWNASIDDDETTYGYPITYGFLNNPLDINDPTTNISIFKEIESPKTDKERAFNVMTNIGTALSEAVPFQPNTFYKVKNRYRYLGEHGGFVTTTDDDPIYFYDKNPEEYCFADGRFDRTIPLYGFFNRIRDYAITGTPYVSNMYYYRLNGRDYLLTSQNAPADWGMAVQKYYRYINHFYEIKNYPGTENDADNMQMGGRSRHDVILDYLTYKYTRINSASIPYESGVYYRLLGNSEQEFYGLYNLSVIPIYELVEGPAPDDWTTGTYYSRSKMEVGERPYIVYYNDHAYANALDENIYEYELLETEPSDWAENYENYYTLAPSTNRLMAYFESKKYPDNRLLYTLLETEPSDWAENYENYYLFENDYTNLYIRDSYVTRKTYHENDDLAYSIFAFNDNYILGDENGNVQGYTLKSDNDTFVSGGYFIKETPESPWEPVIWLPDDFYTAENKYYKKATVKANYIPYGTLIYYNPVLNVIEYDHDLSHYLTYLNNPEQWYVNVNREVTKSTKCKSGNLRLERRIGYSNDFYVTYAIGTSDQIINGAPYIPGNRDLAPNFGICYAFFKNKKIGSSKYDYSDNCQIGAVVNKL